MSTTISAATGGSLAGGLLVKAAIPKVVAQTASLSFTQVGGYDASLALSSAKTAAKTTKLTVSLNLRSVQKYNFSGGSTSALTVTLIDAKGGRTTVDLAKTLTVATTGTYQLCFEQAAGLKATVDGLRLAGTAPAPPSVLPKSSGDSRIDALLMGGTQYWWGNGDVAATQGTAPITPLATGLADNTALKEVTFGFLASAQGTTQDKHGFKVMTAAQKDAVRRAFAYYGKLVNLKFTEVAGNGTADINFGTNNQNGVSAGYSYYPNGGPLQGRVELLLANDQATNSGTGLLEGGYGWETIIHEIGHALGLKHPGNYNAGGGGAAGPFLPTNEDDREHSVMSYYDNNATRGVNPMSAMVYDVAALQYLYGANQAASTAVKGTFKFAAGQKVVETLWSGTGQDTIDLSTLTNSSNVDLNGGSFSSINITGSAASAFYSGNGNVGIAYGAKINAVKLSAKDGVAESVTLNGAFATGSFDRIDGFNASDDKIALKASLFGALGSDSIEFGSAASKASSRIVVNTATGEIFYDADGNGAGAAKKIAQYSAAQGHGQLTGGNFAMVA